MKTKVNVGIAGALTIIAVFRVIGIFVAPLGAVLGYF